MKSGSEKNKDQINLNQNTSKYFVDQKLFVIILPNDESILNIINSELTWLSKGNFYQYYNYYIFINLNGGWL